MSFTQTVTATLTGGMQPLSVSTSETAGHPIPYDEALLTSAADVLVDCVINVAQLKSLFIRGSAGGLVVKINSSSVPDKTLTIPAGVAVIWLAEWASWYPCPLGTVNVASLYVTNSLAAANNFQMDGLVDPTV
jgi:hypothetical protein